MNDDLVDDQLLVGRIEVEGEPRIRLDPHRRNKLLSHMNESLVSGPVYFHVEEEEKYTRRCLFLQRVVAVLCFNGTRPIRDRLN